MITSESILKVVSVSAYHSIIIMYIFGILYVFFLKPFSEMERNEIEFAKIGFRSYLYESADKKNS